MDVARPQGPIRHRLPPIVAAILLAGGSAAAEPQAAVHPEAWPAGPTADRIKPDTEKFVDGLLAKLTLEDKIGQMIQADIASIAPDDLKTYRLGSILAGGNAAPGDDVRTTPAGLARPGRRLFQGVGRSQGPGPSSDPDPVRHRRRARRRQDPRRHHLPAQYRAGRGARSRPGPPDRGGNGRGGRGDRPRLELCPDPRGRPDPALGPDLRKLFGGPRCWSATMRAPWSPACKARPARRISSGPRHVLASPKHFLGDGGTEDGRDQGDNPAPEAALARIHAAGYPARHPGRRADRDGVLQQLARREDARRSRPPDRGAEGRMGFDGFIVGDWNAQEEIPGCTRFDCPAAIDAGLDMVMAPDSWRELYRNTLAEARSGTIPPARIDDAVRRILRVKALAGLFDRPAPKIARARRAFRPAGERRPSRDCPRSGTEIAGAAEERARAAAARGRAHVLVAGEAADDLKMQTGGWTIDWQGDRNTNADFPGATTIYAGIKAAVEAGGGSAAFSPDGTSATRPDAAIVVFGEALMRSSRATGRPWNSRPAQARFGPAEAPPRPQDPDHRRVPVGPPDVGRSRDQRRRRLRRGLAAGHRGRRRGRPPDPRRGRQAPL